MVLLPVLLAGVAAPRPLRASADVSIAILGMRPTDSAELGATRLEELPEAHELRQTLQNVVETVSGARVLGANDVRALLGRAYLVDLFDCAGKPACLVKLTRPLAKRGVDLAIAGDYFATDTELQIRLWIIDVNKRAVRDELTFKLGRAQSKELQAWSAALASVFQDTGWLLLVTNVTGHRCTLDGAACNIDEEGRIGPVKEGEHVLVLTLEGYKDVTKVVRVQRDAESRVDAPMEKLPLQARDAPDPLVLSAPRSKLAVSVAEERISVALIGQLQFIAMVDNHNNGAGFDYVARPRRDVGTGPSFTFLPVPSSLGVSVLSSARPSGWELRAQATGVFSSDLMLALDQVYVDMVHAHSGSLLTLGRTSRGVVNTFSPGTVTIPLGFGNLSPHFTGARGSKSLGPFLLEVGVGRPERRPSVANPQPTPASVPKSSPSVPFFAARLSFLNQDVSGELYGKPFPLTISVSGTAGKLRVGIGEADGLAARFPDAAPPVVEELTYWIASLEYALPLMRWLMVTGEAYVGEGAQMWSGAMFQAPRVRLADGRHRNLGSAGGWVQLSLQLNTAWDLVTVAGYEAIRSGLRFGPPALGSAEPIRSNGFAAAILTLTAMRDLRISVQTHAMQTRYHDGARGEVLALALASQFRF